jgi:hypothetical protein
VKVRSTVIEKTDRLAVENDALDLQAPDRRDDRREGVCPVPPGLRPEMNRPTLTPGDEPVAVPLEFMDPFGPGRDLLRQNRLTGDNKARRSAPLAGEKATPLENHTEEYGRRGPRWKGRGLIKYNDTRTIHGAPSWCR